MLYSEDKIYSIPILKIETSNVDTNAFLGKTKNFFNDSYHNVDNKIRFGTLLRIDFGNMTNGRFLLFTRCNDITAKENFQSSHSFSFSILKEDAVYSLLFCWYDKNGQKVSSKNTINISGLQNKFFWLNVEIEFFEETLEYTHMINYTSQTQTLNIGVLFDTDSINDVINSIQYCFGYNASLANYFCDDFIETLTKPNIEFKSLIFSNFLEGEYKNLYHFWFDNVIFKGSSLRNYGLEQHTIRFEKTFLEANCIENLNENIDYLILKTINSRSNSQKDFSGYLLDENGDILYTEEGEPILLEN